MNVVLQASALLPSGTLAERHRRRRGAQGWAALAVAALEWAVLAVAASAFVAAGAALWFG
jgi:hypothetical protein